MRLTTLMLTIVFWSALLAGIPLFLLVVNDYMDLPVYQHVVMDIAGIALIAVGIMLMGYSAGLIFRLGKGTPAPTEPPEKFVAAGLYRFSRNPMYTGYFSILLGEFLLLGHMLQLLYCFFIVAVINVFIIYFEEPHLEKKFGKKYREYKKNIPRWL